MSVAQVTTREPVTAGPPTTSRAKRLLVIAVVVAAGALGAFLAWRYLWPAGLAPGIAAGNGRIEATEIDVAAKIKNRIKEIYFDEGDFVHAGQAIAKMDTATLEAQRREAEAQLQRATIAVDTAQHLVKQREAEREADIALVAQREAELDGAKRHLQRSIELAPRHDVPEQDSTTTGPEGRGREGGRGLLTGGGGRGKVGDQLGEVAGGGRERVHRRGGGDDRAHPGRP